MLSIREVSPGDTRPEELVGNLPFLFARNLSSRVLGNSPNKVTRGNGLLGAAGCCALQEPGRRKLL